LCAVNNHAHVVQPKAGVLLEFLEHFLPLLTSAIPKYSSCPIPGLTLDFLPEKSVLRQACAISTLANHNRATIRKPCPGEWASEVVKAGFGNSGTIYANITK